MGHNMRLFHNVVKDQSIPSFPDVPKNRDDNRGMHPVVRPMNKQILNAEARSSVRVN